MKFRDLPVGARFRFPDDPSICHRGYGPCVKVSARRYRDDPPQLVDGRYGIEVITHTVGTVNVAVEPDAEPTSTG